MAERMIAERVDRRQVRMLRVLLLFTAMVITTPAPAAAMTLPNAFSTSTVPYRSTLRIV
jgi:hypothetical protein